MSTLILLRHGQSVWNKANLFTGWVDVPLSKQGIEEAISAGKKLQQVPIDTIFVSSLIRAQMTAMLVAGDREKTPIILHEEASYCHHCKEIIPVIVASELNERMYGELQGLNKDEMRAKFGEEQVQIWRRSYNVAPPGGESLEMTAARTIPYFTGKIIPELKAGKNVLVSAHGNSLRAIIMWIEKLSQDEVLHLELATGEPILYTFTEAGFEKNLSG